MKFLFNFLRLIRFPNLVIIGLTQYAIRFGIMYPFYQQAGIELLLSEGLFALLVLATVLIAASGYIINDYFDVKLDHVNKPQQLIIGKRISRRQAMFFHFLINGVGIGIAGYIAFSIQHPMLILFQLVSAALLWFYSVNFKKQILIGNFIIAALTALVPFTAGYYEIALLFDQTLTSANEIPFEAHSFRSFLFNIKYLLYLISGYSIFAFLLTLIREIVKDCEDIKGDEAFGCKTLPIVYGIDKAKQVAIAVTFFLLGGLGVLEYAQFTSHDWISFGYFFFLITLPLICIVWLLKQANKKKDFFVISQTIKVVMLFGILYTGVIYLF